MVTTEQIVRGVGLISLATAIVLALKTLNDATNELKIVGDRATGWFTITRKAKTKPEHPSPEGSGVKNLQGEGQVVGDAVVPDNIDQVSPWNSPRHPFRPISTRMLPTIPNVFQLCWAYRHTSFRNLPSPLQQVHHLHFQCPSHEVEQVLMFTNRKVMTYLV